MIDYRQDVLECVVKQVEVFHEEHGLHIIFDGDIRKLPTDDLEWVQDEIDKINSYLKSKVSIDNEEVTTAISYFDISLEDHEVVYAYENVLLKGLPQVGLV